MAKTKVLIVDDSVTMRQQIDLTLTKEGFELIEACDGEDGIKKLQEVDNIKLVFLDVNMPKMDGLEMLEEIQRKGIFTDVPVIMLTTEIDKRKIHRAKTAGAKGWIIKPFEPYQIIDVANKFTQD
ncbi:MAG: response regulator [Oligoflexales bacterium]